MFHINEFSEYGNPASLNAAYTAEVLPFGAIIGRQGNAVCMSCGTYTTVVSMPRSVVDIADVLDCEHAPYMDLGWAF